MKHRSVGGIVAAFLLALSLQAAAAPLPPQPKQLRIEGTSWGITLAEDGTGFYNELARYLLGDEITDHNYTPSPYRRAMRTFLENHDSCVYPKNLDSLYRTGDWGPDDRLLESDGIIRSPIRLFTPEGKPLIHGKADLEHKRIAYAMGAKIPQSLNVPSARFTAIADEVDKAKLLGTGTVDAIVANMPDVIFVFRHLGKPLPPYDPDYVPVPTPIIRLVCHDTPANRAFLQAFNARLALLFRNSDMDRFLSEHGLDPAFFRPPDAH